MNNNDETLTLFNELNIWFHKSTDHQKLFILLLNELMRTSIITKDDSPVCGYHLYDLLIQNQSLLQYLNLILEYQGLYVDHAEDFYQLTSNLDHIQPDDEDDPSFIKFVNWVDNRKVKLTTSDDSLQIFLALHDYYNKNNENTNKPVTVSYIDFKNYANTIFENSAYKLKNTISKASINRFARYKMTSNVVPIKSKNHDTYDGFKIYNAVNRKFNASNIEHLKQLAAATQFDQKEPNTNAE